MDQIRTYGVLVAAVFGTLCHSESALMAQDDFEGPPISYSETTPDNCISRLQERLNKGEVVLEHDNHFGYIKAVLQALNVPLESQSLVFSKTSLQLRRINPKTPRAIYFNTDVYIGFCQNGDVMEVSAVDPKLGTVFYTMDQKKSDGVPQFDRRTDNCLVCHSSSRTEGVPGHLVRSLLTDAGGQPLLAAGSKNVNHTTPIEERWGGWYVTGLAGSQKHMGNLIMSRDEVPETIDNSAGQNVTDLSDRFSVSQYLTPHSDIVALMVLEHQVLVHNRIARASFAVREALHYETMLNEALKNPQGTRLESTTRRIQSAGDRLVESLLFSGEAKITEPIKGTSGYAEIFAKNAPRDPNGRSLFDLDLNARMFQYPCSYLVYSEAFNALPADMKSYVWQKLWDVLNGKDTTGKFAHLTESDRQAIVEILRATNSDLPDYWRE